MASAPKVCVAPCKNLAPNFTLRILSSIFAVDVPARTAAARLASNRASSISALRCWIINCRSATSRGALCGATKSGVCAIFWVRVISLSNQAVSAIGSAAFSASSAAIDFSTASSSFFNGRFFSLICLRNCASSWRCSREAIGTGAFGVGAATASALAFEIAACAATTASARKRLASSNKYRW